MRRWRTTMHENGRICVSHLLSVKPVSFHSSGLMEGRTVDNAVHLRFASSKIRALAEGDRMPEAEPAPRIESRWPVMLTSVAVLGLVVFLPTRIRAFPGWVPYLIIITLNVPMAALALSADKRRWLGIERVVLLVFFVSLGCTLVDELKYLVVALVRPSNHVDGLQLLASSVAVWASNVLLFSLVYWQIDRGGPEARLNNPRTRPDWIFPRDDDTSLPDKTPTFVDYLFLAYWTATAFSPTDALPITSRAKLLMMLESMVSLVTIIVVAARAVNIIGS